MAPESKTLKKAFAIDVRGPSEAELANAARIAGESMGLRCFITDRYGFDLDTDQRLTGDEVDFFITVHADAPKVMDTFSALYLQSMEASLSQPHRYRQFTANILSYDDIFVNDSPTAASVALRSIYNEPLHLLPEIEFHTSISEPCIAPVRKQRRLMYIGIRWQKDRHPGLLEALDRENLAEFYGTNTHFDWEGFKNYRGPLPFDGRAVIEKASELGAMLAIFSDEHNRAGLVPTRFFEGPAAGAVVICDQNPFPRREFGDCLLYIDTRKDDVLEQIGKHMEWMNAHPDEALQMAERAQQIFVERFSMNHYLDNIYASLPKRKKALAFGLDPADADNPKVQLLYLLTDPSDAGVEHLVDSCRRQDYRAVQLTVLMEPDDSIAKKLTAAFGKKSGKMDIRILSVPNLVEDSLTRMGHVLSEAIRSIEDETFDYLVVQTSAEQPFSNHISSLVRLMQRSPDQRIGATTEVIERLSLRKGEDPYDYSPGVSVQVQPSVDFSGNLDEQPIGFARFIFHKQVISDIKGPVLSLLPYLHHKALAALTANQSVAQSSLATVRVNAETPFFQQPVNHKIEDLLLQQVHPTFRGPEAAQQRALQAERHQLQNEQQHLHQHIREWETDQQQLRKRMKKRFRRINRVIVTILLAWLLLELLR